MSKPLHIEGEVLRVQWQNPHAYVALNVKNSSGATAEWRVEVSNPSILQLLGWRKDTVVPGMSVRVGGYPSKDGTRTFGSTVFTILSTQRVFKTPACWWGPKAVTLADIQNSKCPIADVP